MTRSGSIDWGMGELLAFGSLLLEGTPVRLAGQDSPRHVRAAARGPHRPDQRLRSGLPLLYLGENQARFWVYDSLLSEYAAMGFEYGYSVERPDALVLWEAQFGDFANGAQTIVDEFISSAEQKWNQRSSGGPAAAARLRGPGPGPLARPASSATCSCAPRTT
jgi:2-oxoglutarate decarboxylase